MGDTEALGAVRCIARPMPYAVDFEAAGVIIVPSTSRKFMRVMPMARPMVTTMRNARPPATPAPAVQPRLKWPANVVAANMFMSLSVLRLVPLGLLGEAIEAQEPLDRPSPGKYPLTSANDARVSQPRQSGRHRHREASGGLAPATSSTTTPFQKATWSRIRRARGLGCRYVHAAARFVRPSTVTS